MEKMRFESVDGFGRVELFYGIRPDFVMRKRTKR